MGIMLDNEVTQFLIDSGQISTNFGNVIIVKVLLPKNNSNLNLYPLDYKYDLYKTEIKKSTNGNDFYYIRHYVFKFNLEEYIEKIVKKLAEDLLQNNQVLDFTITY